MRTLLSSIIFLLLLILTGTAQAEKENLPPSKIEAYVELPTGNPYVGEPLRLVLKSAIHAPIAKDRITQPSLTDFDWQQFGVDSFHDELIDGFWMPVITRVLMIYPLRAGQLNIDPFKRQITFYTHDGTQSEIELISSPVSINVVPRETILPDNEFWIPAKKVTITDKWEPEPDKIQPGETAQRTLTLEADGLTADRLPTLPPFRAPGIITFAGPVDRQTIITDQGPIGRAIYQWRLRPVSNSIATAPPITLRWFDTTMRKMREVTTAERQVSFRVDNKNSNSHIRAQSKRITSLRIASAFLVSLATTAMLISLFYHFEYSFISSYLFIPILLKLLLTLHYAASSRQADRFYRILNEARNLKQPFLLKLFKDKKIQRHIQIIESHIYGFQKQDIDYSMKYLTSLLFKGYFHLLINKAKPTI